MTSLRARLSLPVPITAPLVLNPLMARMVEAAGFPPRRDRAAKVREAVAARLLAVERATVEKRQA